MRTQSGRLENGREVLWLNDGTLALAVAPGGGHIAAVRSVAPGAASPLWIPPWPSHEPDMVTDAMVAAEYGGPPEGRTLASILGHSLALDLFGTPSPEEAAAGVLTHGFFGARQWRWEAADGLAGACEDDRSAMRVQRRIRLVGALAWVEEAITNLSVWDRPIAWQQHVTLGPPWLEDGAFWLAANAERGRAFPQPLGDGSRLAPGSEGAWPRMPAKDGGTVDYRRLPAAPATEFAAFRIAPEAAWGYFLAGNRRLGQVLFYAWPRAVFPWLGIWDERQARHTAPWNGRTWTRGLEFGASPFPTNRRELLRQPELWDTPTCAWLPARARVSVRYALGLFAYTGEADAALRWDGGEVQLWAGGRRVAALPWSP
ncbi:MAG: hypothetical protein ACRD2E_03200 [Terriglobales bacterium]